MIFKNEGGAQIKRMQATPNLEREKDKDHFDHRTDIPASMRADICESLERIPEIASWSNTTALRSHARYLGIPVAPLTPDELDRTRQCVRSELTVTFLNEKGYEFLTNVALLDRALMFSLPIQDAERLTTALELLKKPATPWRGRMTLRLFRPTYQQPDPTPSLQMELQESGRKIAEGNGWIGEFAKLASARIAGYEIPALSPRTWERFRYLQKQYEKVLGSDPRDAVEFLFYGRILAAEKVWVDDEGLHIIDVPQRTAGEALLPVPTPKRL